jgi:hypothetical protein
MHKYNSLVTIAVIFLGLIVLSMVTLGFVHSAIATPSVPEFSLKYVDCSYDTQPVYSIDPHTGKSVMTDPSYHIKNKTIEVTIKNQPFSSSIDSSGNWTSLYYELRFKGHYESDWASYPQRPNYGYTNASLTSYTTISLGYSQLGDVPDGGQEDVQVIALIGHDNEYAVFGTFGEGREYVFSGEASDWSTTQTITIGQSTPTTTPSQSTTSSPTQNPTTTPSVTQFFSFSTFEVVMVALLVVVAVLLVFVVFYLRKRSVGSSPV